MYQVQRFPLFATTLFARNSRSLLLAVSCELPTKLAPVLQGKERKQFSHCTGKSGIMADPSPAEVGKREFVRALSVDENDGGADVLGGGGAAAAATSAPTVDLTYQRFQPDVEPVGWWEPEATHLAVRDVKYLDDKKKCQSAPSVFECVEVECFQVSKAQRKVRPLFVVHAIAVSFACRLPNCASQGS